MSCSIEELTYDYQSPQLVKELNLSATSRIKIHFITHLEPFLNLRSLILSNNMIQHIQGLHTLRHLRVLNLEFNQIRSIQGTDHLLHLEELYLSYNDIQAVGCCLLKNRKIKTLHLAYNDIKGLEDISVLYTLCSSDDNEADQRSISQNGLAQSRNRYVLSLLSTLSLYGNPVIATINYLSFLKMLIPSLVFVDQHNVNESGVSGNVCPQEEVVILREALNNLLDERDAAVQQLQSYAEEQISETRNQKYPKLIQNNKREKNFKMNEQELRLEIDYVKFKEAQQKNKKQFREWIQLIENARKKYAERMKQHKKKVSELSEQYTSAIKRKRQSKEREEPDASRISCLNFEEERAAEISQTPKKNFTYQHSLIKELQEYDPERNKKILHQIKDLQYEIERNAKKIKNLDRLMIEVQKKKAEHRGNQPDLYLKILQLIVFGYDQTPKSRLELQEKCYRLCKKFLIEQQGEKEEEKGLLYHIELLKSIVFGSHHSFSTSYIQANPLRQADPYALKEKIKDKNLLEIIAELKTLHSKERKEVSKFEKEKNSFIKQFQTQTEELALGWEELNKQRDQFQRRKEKQLRDLTKSINKNRQAAIEKYRNVEQEQKKKITDLKTERQSLVSQIREMQRTLNQTQQVLNRKFIELEEFENHFNQFIEEKEKIRSLESDLNEITVELEKEQKKMDQYLVKIRELKLEEGILGDRVQNLDQQIRLRTNQLREIQENMDKIQLSYGKTHEELSSSMIKLRELNSQVLRKSEQLKELQKFSQRNKKNYHLMEDKIRNIEHIQSNKKLAIKQLESELKILKEEKASVVLEIESMDKKVECKRQELVRCQLKIQQSKLAMESLADINRSINDMLIRQSELKRSIIELEIENKNLLEMKNNLLEDFRMKQYI